MPINTEPNEAISIPDRIKKIRQVAADNDDRRFADRGDNWREFSQWWDAKIDQESVPLHHQEQESN